MQSNQRVQQGGFTLLEILIVILVLGILAGIVVFAVGTLGGPASTNACKTEADTVKTAMQSYRTQHNGTPPTTTGSPYDVPAKAGGMTKTLHDADLLSNDTVKWYVGASDATNEINWSISDDGAVLSSSCAG